MWGTIVNFFAVVLGGLMGSFIKAGFTKKIVSIGGLIIAAVAAAAAAGVFLFGDRTGVSPWLILAGGAVALLLWLLLGRLLKNGLPERYSGIIMQGVGLSVVIIGLGSAFKSHNMLLVIMSLVVGGIIGEWIDIEKRLDALGSWAQKKLSRDKSSTFSQGFVSASLIFCVGAMAIVGALEGGLQGNYLTLYAKSTLDGITSIVLASTLGMGVTFSALAVLLYQGSITLAAGFLQPILSEMVIDEMSAVGGILILGIGLSMLEIKKIKVGNLLPSIFIPALYFPLAELIKNLLGI